MRADGEAMRLVAQALDEIKRGIARRQPERLAPRDEKHLASGVAVGPLGDGGQVTPVTPSSSSTARTASNWPRPPSIRIRSGACGKASGSEGALGVLFGLFQQAGKPSRQNLAHHGVIVAGGEFALDVEGAVLVFHETLGPATIIAPIAAPPMMWELS